MKVKLVVQDKSPLRRWGTFLAALENEVNAWLSANPDIRIVHITQSSNGGSLDTSKIFLSVWYEERDDESDAPAPPRSTAFRRGQ